MNPINDPTTLAAHLDDPDWLVVDCRFDLADPTAGERAWTATHIPGAVYAHLDRDLSGPKTTDGRGGRHPLPDPDHLRETFGRLGIGPGVSVVAYDDTSGHYAARLWWLLRFMGYDNVMILDGGWPAWQAAGLPVSAEATTPVARVFSGSPHWEQVVLIDDVPDAPLLVDGRAPERYRGEVEPIDPVAGHIPGAINRPYAANWSDGRWRSGEALREAFAELLGPVAPGEAVFYCGSGVSACVNLVAMARAGLPVGRLYVGSWSEWSRLRGSSQP